MDTMRVGEEYVVTQSSNDNTFKSGDRIRLEEDGSIENRTANGWIEEEDVKEAIQGMKVKKAT